MHTYIFFPNPQTGKLSILYNIFNRNLFLLKTSSYIERSVTWSMGITGINKLAFTVLRDNISIKLINIKR